MREEVSCEEDKEGGEGREGERGRGKREGEEGQGKRDRGRWRTRGRGRGGKREDEEGGRGRESVNVGMRQCPGNRVTTALHSLIHVLPHTFSLHILTTHVHAPVSHRQQVT